MISQLPFRALVTLSSGQPPDSKTCHSSARSYSNCSICFKAISIFIYICQARALLHLVSETNECPNRQPPGARAKCGTKSRNSTAILFLERFLSHAPHLITSKFQNYCHSNSTLSRSGLNFSTF